MQYRIRLSVWTIEGTSLEDARQKAVALVRSNADSLVTVAPDVPKQGPLNQLVFGAKK